MSTSRIQGSGNVDAFRTYYTPDDPPVREDDFCVFSEADKKETREVDGIEREIRVGTDEFGNKYSYLEGTNERLVNVTKNTYMTQSEFRAYVKSVTGYDNLPNGVSAEFINGNLTFKKDGKKINLNEVRELSANEQTERERQEELKEKGNALKTNFTNQMKEILKVDNIPDGIEITEQDGDFVFIDKATNQVLSYEDLIAHDKIKTAQQEKIERDNAVSDMEDMITSPEFDLVLNMQELGITKPSELRTYMEQHVHEYLPEIVALHTTTDANGKKTVDTKALIEIVRNNYDIRQLSGASADDINARLKQQKSPMVGMGQAFLDAEEKYGINAWAILGIIGIESSYGKVPAEGTEGNFCGMKGVGSNDHRELKGSTNAQTYRNNINAVAFQLRLDVQPSRMRNTVAKEAQKYCPPNHVKWSQFVGGEILQGQMRNMPAVREEYLSLLRNESNDTFAQNR